VIPTEDLILTPPLWALGKTPRVIAYGPFIAERGKNKLVGMYLRQEDEDTIVFWDGTRERYFAEDEITLRGMETKDAALVELDPKRAGLTKEDVITKALLAFQPRPL
jgi:hypothetical protein